ncbi:MAG: two-component system, NtrC family, response regulator AtoC [Pyrinomonadaceae bacterium]|jgi:transcriptional regulator with PAS, ATPase and Fis domain|nr:two-component system, NtrC family, response regulator AtoC [Pyrinomonadaceae bacterium]
MSNNSDLRPEAIIFLAADEDTKQVVREAHALARAPSPITILGAAGVGKESLARAIHEWSGRPGDVTVLDCATVQEDELFFCLDTVSPLVLKNITQLPPIFCTEMVRQLITNEPSRVRIIATSTLNVDPASAPTMPRQLINYLQTIQLVLEPLAERPQDLVLLVSRFLEEANSRYNKHVHVQPEALPFFLALNYPENVATLQQLIERTVAAAEREAIVTTEAIELAAERESLPRSLIDPWAGLSLQQELIVHERRLIRRALERVNGSITKASRLLGMTHQSLSNKIQSRHPELEAVRSPPKARKRIDVLTNPSDL